MLAALLARPRILWIDVLRGLLILLVVIGHSISGDNKLEKHAFAFLVPAFFFLSGYLFNPEKSFSSTLKSAAKRLLLPYALIGLFYMVLQGIIVEHVTNPVIGWTTLIRQAFFSYLYATGLAVNVPVAAIGVIWFFPCLFVAAILFYAIFHISRRQQPYVIWLLAVLVSLLGVYLGSLRPLPWSADIAMAMQVFLLAGYMCARHKVFNKKATLVSLMVCACLWVLAYLHHGLGMSVNSRIYGSFSINTAGALGAIYIAVFIAQCIAETGAGKYIAYLGKAAGVILCFHMLDNYIRFAFFFPYAWSFVGDTWWLIVIVRLSLSLAIYEILRRTLFVKLDTRVALP